MIDRSAPAQRPLGRPIGFQRWRHLLFLHWALGAEALRPLVPPELAIDTYEGRAFVGLVPFTMRDVRPSWSPSVPGVSNFHETNLRTYVVLGDRPGVYFFSLDAAASIAVAAARAAWRLPYFRASMQLELDEPNVTYTSRRRWPGPKPADLAVSYRIGDELGAAVPGSLEHFLVERYLLFVRRRGRVQVGQVHHHPYPLRRAEVLSLEQSMLSAAKVPDSHDAPHVLYSPGVDVDIFRLRDPDVRT